MRAPFVGGAAAKTDARARRAATGTAASARAHVISAAAVTAVERVASYGARAPAFRRLAARQYNRATLRAPAALSPVHLLVVARRSGGGGGDSKNERSFSL